LSGTATSAQNFYVVATITTGSDTTNAGLVLGVPNTSYGRQNLLFRLNNGQYQICFVYTDYNFYSCTTYAEAGPTWTAGATHTMKVHYYVSGGNNYYGLYVDSYQFVTYYINSAGWVPTNNNGIHSDGTKTYFSDFFVATPTSISFTLSACNVPSSTVLSMISQTLGVPTTSLVGLTVTGCSKKERKPYY